MGEHISYRTNLIQATGGLYNIEVRIPGDLVEPVGRIVFVRSLTTRDKDEALKLLPTYRERIIGALEAVRTEIGKSCDPERDRTASETPLAAAIRNVHLLYSETHFRLDDASIKLVMRSVDQLIRDFRIDVSPYSRDYWRLCRRIRRFQLEGAASSYRISQRSDPAQTEILRRPQTFGELVAAFEAEVGVDWSRLRRANYRKAFETACEFFGPHTPVTSLTRQDFVRLRSLLEDLSPQHWWLRETRDLPLVEAAQRCRELGLPKRAVATLNQTLRMYFRLMAWAEVERIVERNCAVQLDRLQRPTSKRKCFPFETDQLKLIFSSGPLYDRCLPLGRRKAPFWLPLMALFGGLRLGEAAQLGVGDVFYRNKIPAMLIRCEESDDGQPGKSIKTRNAFRFVPVHPILEAIGFIDYVAATKEAGHVALFPEFWSPARGFRYNRFPNAFAHYLQKIGARSPHVSFRSLRHNFRDALRDADVAPERARVLGGWAPRTTDAKYGTGGNLALFYRDIRRISYPVSFEHLFLKELTVNTYVAGDPPLDERNEPATDLLATGRAGSRPDQTVVVLVEGREVGRVTLERGRLSFQYDRDWCDADDSYPISMSLPLGTLKHGHAAVDGFLWGLLPEDHRVIESWNRRFGIPRRNPLALLANVGQDCAGAIQFSTDEDRSRLSSTEGGVSWLSESQVASRLRALRTDPGAWRQPEDLGQCALAGAQAKTALLFDGSRWGVPHGVVPTTHILKLDPNGLEGHAANEHLCLELARALELPAVRTSLGRFENQTVLVIERYDRVVAKASIARVHQEDICQALGISPFQKYQSEGGPGIAAAVDLLKKVTKDPERDAQTFLSAVIFNWVIAGTDAHAKNYSILIGPRGAVALAPLYDIATILPYHSIDPQKSKFAMKVGDHYRLRDITSRAWAKLAVELNVAPEIVFTRIRSLAKDIPTKVANIVRQIEEPGPIALAAAERIAHRAAKVEAMLDLFEAAHHGSLSS